MNFEYRTSRAHMVELRIPQHSSPLHEHKAFVTFHPDDAFYHEEFERVYGYFVEDVFGTHVLSAGTSAQDHVAKLAAVPHLVQATLLVALYGEHTRFDSRVAWDIEAGLSGRVGVHMGLMVMLLPSFPAAPIDRAGFVDETCVYPYLHKHTARNLESGYANLYAWPGTYDHPGITEYPVTHAFQDTLFKRDTQAHLIQHDVLSE